MGNFIGDSVRGRQLELYPAGIAAGILLHRRIDAFTDSHPVVQQTKDRLRPLYHKYAGVVADMYYDHFLAVNFHLYSPQSLADFSQQVYGVVQRHLGLLPDKVKYFLPYMMEQNWLLNYATLSGIGRSLIGLSRRTTFASHMETAAAELEQHYPLYEKDFGAFFPDLQAYVSRQIAGQAFAAGGASPQ